MRKLYLYILVILLSLSIDVSAGEAGQIEQTDSMHSSVPVVSHFQLRGTLFTRSLKPIAMIEDTRNGQITMYEPGDNLEDGVELVSIARGEVVIKTSQQQHLLSFPAEAVIQPRSPKTKPDDKNWYRIIKEGDLFIVDEQTIASAVMRAREIMSNVKIRPYFADGKQCGMLVTKLTPIGILKDAGVVEGDIVTGVNGLKVNTPYQIFSAYRKIRNEQEIQVNITRDRKPLTLTYKVRKTI